MTKHAAWIIHFKAHMDEFSLMNLDGSEYIAGIIIVPGHSMRAALDALDDYLSKNRMWVMDVSKCERYVPENFTAPTKENKDIIEVAETVLIYQASEFVSGASSKVLEDEEGEAT
ncbi:hypothetical protein EUZ85_00330 [Hahella sp. KA22]|uniref:hypothetical protein n=1 Tax=Hahella sp. KA22 TaxID=1628392 RepID=UPI000FDEBA7F|nr:hypothetical protein [Hahella sp. KA22]AZZ94944.1 hypothetical protein ENC22_28620 [Hahella sp. KA22]QAY52589.1 hypothetical protein EUZ85_00330 [Hahella sp. KA22]